MNKQQRAAFLRRIDTLGKAIQEFEKNPGVKEKEQLRELTLGWVSMLELLPFEWKAEEQHGVDTCYIDGKLFAQVDKPTTERDGWMVTVFGFLGAKFFETRDKAKQFVVDQRVSKLLCYYPSVFASDRYDAFRPQSTLWLFGLSHETLSQ